MLDNVKQDGAVKARYIWTADGAKRAVADAARSNGFEYLGSLVYARMNGVLELESANLADGRILKTSNSYYVQYYYKDHLGSVRFVEGNFGRDDYMPYGSRMQADGYATSSSRTKFSGKEMQTLSVTTSGGALAQLGLYDFGARMYDPVTARWLTQDPLAEKYYEVSQYVYCGGNPVNRIDLDGRKWDNIQDAENLKKEIENKKQALKSQIATNQSAIENSTSKKEIRKLNRENNELTERVSRLDASQTNLDMIGADQKETYAFAQSPNGVGYVKKESDGKVYIYNDGTETKIHETTHVAQYIKNNGVNMFFDDHTNELVYRVGRTMSYEIPAYKNQFSFDPKSYPGVAKSIHDINSQSIGRIRDNSGQQLYKAYFEYLKTKKR